MFCSAEDSILIHQKPNALCKAKKKKKVNCSDYNKNEVGKTDRNLFTRLNEHGSQKD